jgi:porin
MKPTAKPKSVNFPTLLVSLILLINSPIILATESTSEINFVYSSDFLRNQRGGIKEASAYIDFATIELSHQIQFESGLNVAFVGSLLYANGAKFSETIVGDSQGASGSETGVNLKRVYESYVDLTAGKHSVLLGLFDTNTEFDVMESANLFVNAAHGMGNTLGSSGANGPSTYPFPGLSLRYQYATEDFTIRTVFTDGVPGDDKQLDELGLSLSSNEGYLHIAELELRQAQTEWLTGLWHYNKSDLPNENQKTRSTGVYLRAEHTFEHLAGLTGFARIDSASSNTNQFDKFFSVGLVKTGIFKNRKDDQIGVAIAYAHLSNQSQQLLSGDPSEFASGETNIEFTYSAKINHWLSIQPVIQWIKNPSALVQQQLSSKTALVIGVRTTIAL